MKVALVYDRINKWGGAERLLLALKKLYPEAPVYTSFYAPEKAKWAKNFVVKSSFLQPFGFFRTRHQKLPFLMPFAFESFDFSSFDVVISVTSAEAKGIITSPGTLHICYILTPARYLYSHSKEYLQSTGALSFLASPILDKLRQWDQIACRRPDKYVAISALVQDRVEKHYGSEAEIIYPPLCIGSEAQRIEDLKGERGKGRKEEDKKFFLVVSRLEPYKRVDLLIKVFNKLGWPLCIVGTGSQEKSLKRAAKANIKFTGELTDDDLFDYYKACTALIMPQEEDFGLVSLEAQSFYKPVLAFGRGGALETVKQGKTGIFFDKQTEESLEKGLVNIKNLIVLKKFNKKDFDINLEKFSFENFKNKFGRMVEKEWQRYQKQT